MEEKSNIVSVCGLWKNTTPDGRTYLSGSIGFAKMLIFPVRNQKEGGPQFTLCIAEKQERSEAASQDDPFGESAQEGAPF